MADQEKQAANDPVDGETVGVVVHVHVRMPTLYYMTRLPDLLSEQGMNALELYLGLPRNSVFGIVAERKTK